MKYFIVSDIHGSSLALSKAIDRFEQERCDMLCILGDVLYHGPRNALPGGHDPKGVVDMLNQYHERVIAVRGNCDAEVDQLMLNFPCMSDYALVVDQGRRLFLTHGHVYAEGEWPYMLPRGSVVFSGHTHIARLFEQDGLIYVNPGSISLPKAPCGIPGEIAVVRGGIVQPSYAVYDGAPGGTAGAAVLSICNLDDGTTAAKHSFGPA